jgi:hypothetical protein
MSALTNSTSGSIEEVGLSKGTMTAKRFSADLSADIGQQPRRK